MDVKWSLRAKFKDVLVKKVFFTIFGVCPWCVFSVYFRFIISCFVICVLVILGMSVVFSC